MDKIKRFLPICTVITGVLAIIAYCALPVLEFTLEEFSFEKVEIFKVEYSGTKAAFGFKFYGESVKGSVWCFFAPFFAAMAVIFSISAFFKPKQKNFANNALIFFLIAGLGFLFTKELFRLGYEMPREVANTCELGIGAMLAGLLSMLSAIFIVIYHKPMKKNDEEKN